MMTRHILYPIAIAALSTIAITAARADMLAALSGDATLSIIDSKAKKITRTVTVTGIAGKLAGIDVRPADGVLYALAVDGTLYTVDTSTGKATMKVKLETMVAAGPTVVDFNPVADRLRVIGADGTNLRANVDDGKVITDKPLNYAETDVNKGKTPKVTAGAYSNSFKGTKETALYDIDAALGTYLKQVPPNDGVLTSIGATGVKANDVAFDIAADGNGGNTGYLVANGRLYTLDITSGKATEQGTIQGLPGNVRDVAVIAN